MAKEKPSEAAEAVIQPPPETLGGEAPPPEKKEPEKDPLAELEARLTAKFEKEIKERDDKISALSKPAPVQPGPTVVEKIDVYKDLGTKIWEDTPKALKELSDEIEARVEKKLRAEYQATKSEEKFWDDFYRSNKSFNRDDDHWVVQAVVNENFSAWKDLPVAKVKEELAKETEKRLAKIEARKERAVEKGAPTMGLTGSAPPSPKKEPAEEKPKTLSQMIRDKQQMRQTALFKRQEARGRDDQGRFRKELN